LVGKATTDTLTNKTLTGAAMNGTVGATTPSTGAFTTLSATGVTTVQAGTAAAPAITTTGDTNTGIFFPAADTIAFAEGGVEAMRIDASGNLGLGVTPSPWSIGTAFQIGLANNVSILGYNTSGFYQTNSYFDAGWKYAANGYAVQYLQINGTHQWLVGANNTSGAGATVTAFGLGSAMTLDNSGNLLVGTTSVNSVGVISVDFLGQTKQGITLDDTWASTGGVYILFRNSAGDTAGRIDHNGTTTVAYTTSSDYRLKENIAPMTGALTKVLQLNPVTYKWKSDGTDGQGFIAHELQAIVPDAVVGAKDAMNEDGSINPQGIDTSFLVATLTAAIQEQQVLITQLTARITALESA
jgi:hypothetical protein